MGLFTTYKGNLNILVWRKKTLSTGDILKKSFALMLCIALMVTCFAGCHKKGEIAVKIGDIEFA